jgi:hypothetical protein
MAARHHTAGAAWVHVRPLRPPHTREPQPPNALPPAPIISRRSPGIQLVRPRRYAAAGAPAGPRPRGSHLNAATGERPAKKEHPSPVTTPRSPGQINLPLDKKGPHGCTSLLYGAQRLMAVGSESAVVVVRASVLFGLGDGALVAAVYEALYG